MFFAASASPSAVIFPAAIAPKSICKSRLNSFFLFSSNSEFSTCSESVFLSSLSLSSSLDSSSFLAASSSGFSSFSLLSSFRVFSSSSGSFFVGVVNFLEANSIVFFCSHLLGLLFYQML